MDVQRTCFTMGCRPYADSPSSVRVRWYRTPRGAPVFPLPHAFTMGWLYGEQCRDNDPEGIGMLPESRRYDKGATALPYRANGHFTGRPEQWTDGSKITTDDILHWNPNGWSQECATALGWFPEAMWWRAEDAVLDGFGGTVVSVPDRTGGGHDLSSPLGPSVPFLADDGDGFAAILFRPGPLVTSDMARSLVDIVSAPALSYFTVHAVLSGRVGARGLVPGMGVNAFAHPTLTGAPVFGPHQWGVNQTGGAYLQSLPFSPGRHVYSVRAGGGTVTLAIDGCTVGTAGYSQANPIVPRFLSYCGVGDPVAGRPAPGDVSESRLYEMVILPYVGEDSEGAAWVRFLADKYRIPTEACDMPPIGSIVPYAGPNDPSGYLECDGRSVARSTYFLLYGAIGDAWGSPPDADHFVLPDLRGRVPVGAGLGPGLTNVPLGQVDGQEDLVLAVGQLPAHDHPLSDPGHDHAVFDPGHFHAPSNLAHFGTDSTNPGDNTVTGGGGDESVSFTTAEATGVVVQANATGVTIGMTGSGDPVSTLPPRAAVRMLIYAGA